MKISLRHQKIFLLSMFFFSTAALFAQLNITAVNTNHMITFDASLSGVNESVFDGSGFQATPSSGQLDSDAWSISGFSDGDLAFGGTQTTAETDYTRGIHNGGTGMGGIYAFEVSSGNYALGYQATNDDFTPGEIVLKIVNSTGASIDNIELSYKIYVYNDQERSNAVKFYHSSNNVDDIEVGNLELLSVEEADVSPEWKSYIMNYTLTGISVANLSNYYFKWVGEDATGSGSRDEFALDDIKVSSSTNDLSTDVTAATLIPTNTISSLVDTPAEAVSVLQLRFHDDAAGDGQPTQVSNIRVYASDHNTASWMDNIQGAQLYASSTIISPISIGITDSYFDLEFASGDISIADGGTADYDLQVYLNTSNLTDNGVLAFMVDADNHNFATHPAGSGFSPTFSGGDITSNDFTIDVQAVELHFIDQPGNVIVNSNFIPAPSVGLTDVNGNIDLDHSGATIQMSSTGSMSGGNQDANVSSSGLALFNGLQMSASGTSITLTASDFNDVIGTSQTVTSNSFDVYSQPQLLISEVAHPYGSTNAQFVELYNAGGSDIDFGTETYYLSKQTNGSTWSDVQLDTTKTISAAGCYVIAYSSSSFTVAFSVTADQTSGSVVHINGNDPIFLYKGGDHTTGALVDIYGEMNTDGENTDWYYEKSQGLRKRSVSEPVNVWSSAEWVILDTADKAYFTPGYHRLSLSWLGSVSNDFHDKSNWSPSNCGPDASFDLTVNSSANDVVVGKGACNDLTIGIDAQVKVYPDYLVVVGDIQNNAGEEGLYLQASTDYKRGLLLNNTNEVDAMISTYYHPDAYDDWFLIAPPLVGDTASLFMGMYLDYWDEPSEKWIAIEDEETPLEIMKGYALHHMTLYANYDGKIQAGDQTASLLYNSGNANGGDDFTGYNLLGNPFPANIDWDQVSIPSNMDGGVSVWDRDAKNYISWIKGNADNAARYIQLGEAFFVHTNAALSFTLGDDVKSVKGMRTLYKKGVSSPDSWPANSLSVKVYAEDGKWDQTYINFRETAAWEFEWNMDVRKLFGAADVPQIFSYVNLDEAKKVAINGIPFPQADDVVPIGFRANAPGNYQMEFEGIDSFNSQQPFYLLDRVNGKAYDMRMNSVINFYYSTSDPEHRFSLFFDYTTDVKQGGLAENKKKWNVYAVGNRLFIKSLEEEEEGQVDIYNVQGQLVFSSQNIRAFENGEGLYLPPAYYLVSIISFKKVQNEKILISRY
jgi:hypothetical protein